MIQVVKISVEGEAHPIICESEILEVYCKGHNLTILTTSEDTVQCRRGSVEPVRQEESVKPQARPVPGKE